MFTASFQWSLSALRVQVTTLHHLSPEFCLQFFGESVDNNCTWPYISKYFHVRIHLFLEIVIPLYLILMLFHFLFVLWTKTYI
jgi:hypothetical protein